MIMNKKQNFLVKVLREYAKENKTVCRSTSDLSPLEEWLILRLYNVNNNISSGRVVDIAFI